MVSNPYLFVSQFRPFGRGTTTITMVINHLLILTQPMDPEKKSLNFIFPTKYVIPKSLKFSHWPSKNWDDPPSGGSQWTALKGSKKNNNMPALKKYLQDKTTCARVDQLLILGMVIPPL